MRKKGFCGENGIFISVYFWGIDLMATVGANNAAALGEKIVNCQYNFPSPNFCPIRILIRINKDIII